MGKFLPKQTKHCISAKAKISRASDDQVPDVQDTAAAPSPQPAILPRGLLLGGLAVLALQALGVYLFARGFLLTRAALKDVSNAQELPRVDAGLVAGFADDRTLATGGMAPLYPLAPEERGCNGTGMWYPARFQRAMVLIIDALRIDFATPDNGTARDAPYHNRLPIIDSVLRERNDRAMLYRARADPPTTTLQRLKGITTGQLPTFIDAGKNFAGTAIEEDNWVAQMLSAPTCRPDRLCKGGQSSPRIPRPRNTVFLGDDTWVATFPQFSPDRLSMRHDGKPQCGWNLYRPMPSLNVWDLETVDDGIITRLPYLMLPPVAEGAGDAHVSESWAIWRSLVAQEHMWDDPDFYGQSNSTLDVGDISPLVRGDLYDSWDLIIAHTLGVDHCGHRFGPGRPQMATKLDQMNTLISLMIDALDRAAEITGDYDTVLYIMGDHGMDLMGDHGGESDMELDAAMFVYSPRWGWNAQRGNRRAARVMAAMTERLSVNSLRDEVADDLTSAWWDNHYVEPATPLRSLSQIDMVSTLSMTLGLPIPFNNLGAVIPELVANDVVKLLYSPEGGNHNTVEEWGLLRALRLNSHQLLAYLQRYMQTSKFHGFSDDSVRLWYRLFGAAEAAYAELDKTRQEPGRDVEALEEETAIRYYLFLRVCLSALRRVWAQFDIPLIGLGLLVLTTSVALVGRCIYLLKVGVPDSRPLLGITTTGLGANVAACLSITGGIITAWVMARLHSNAATWEALVGGAVASLLATELLCCLISSVRGPKPSSSKSAHLSPSLGHQNRFPASSPHPFVRYDQILTTIALAMLMVHSLMFASNSFVSLEDVSVLYITQTLAFALLLCALAAPSPPSIVTVPVYNRPKYRAVFCAAALLLISRISRISVVCREELASICVPTFYGGSASSTVSSVPLALANLSTVAVVPLVVRFALARSKSHTAPIVRGWISLGLPLSLALAATHWLLDSINNELTHHGDVLSNIDASARLFGWLKLDDSWNTVKLVASRLSLSVALGGGLSAWVFDPLCLNIAVVGPGSTDGDAQKSHPASDPASSKTAVILGFGNAYGSSYLVFLSIVFCILYVVQQPMGEIMLSAHFVQIILCVELFDSLRDCHQYALDVGGQRSSSHSSGISAPTSSMRRNKLTKKMVGPASTAREVHERRDAEIEYQRYSTYLIPQVIYLTLIAYVHYFSTGHQFNLATVHWSSAFVVLREVHFVLSGILVALNSLGSFLLVSLALPLVVLWNSPLSNKLLRHAPSWFTALLGQCMLVHFGYNAAIMTSTAICTSWLRRALHVWSIFVPRFIFSVPIALVATMLVTLALSIGFATNYVIRQTQKPKAM